MTGHVRRRGTRSWELKFDIGDDQTGKRKTRYASFRGTKRDAELELAKLITAAANGEQVDPSKLTLNEFLDRWEKDWCAGNVSPKTRERYAELLRIHVRPTLGALKIQKLRPVHLSGLYGTLQRDARLAPRTIGHVHRALHRALGHATAWDITQQNIAAKVVPPRVAHKEIAILTVAQVKVVLETARGKNQSWGRPIFHIATLALASGMRRGELLALRWQDVDLDRAMITVARSLEQTKAGLRFKEPKTAHGRRTIELPATAVTELRAHWRAQQEDRFALGAGKSPPEALVFSDLDGEPRLPNAITKEWQRTAKAAGMASATLHSLRHTHASHLIANGLDILTISRRLGHGSPTITLAVYGHLFPQTDNRAAQIMEAAFIGAADAAS